MTKNTPQTTSPARDQAIKRTIRQATAADLSFLLHLQRTWSNNVGFLPRQCFERYTLSGQILVVTENATPAGYLSWTAAPNGLLRLPQVAVHPDLLRTTIGTKLLRHVVRAAQRHCCSVVRLTSRSDLPANDFWPTLGFRCTAILTPKTTRNRPLLEWTLPLISSDALLTATSRHRRLARLESELLPDSLLP
jgi:N-acetylglutamate synthase-like GNAT family acetyltransferase